MPARTSVLLNVPSVTKSLEWYEALGFRVVDRRARDDGELTYVDLELDGAELSLANIDINDDPAFQEWVSTPLGAGVVVWITVNDIAAYERRARQARALFETPLTERSYGRVFMLNDPDGYTIAFLEERTPAPSKARRGAGPAARHGTGSSKTSRTKRRAR